MWANNFNKGSPESDTMLEYSIMIVKLGGAGYRAAYFLYGVFPVPLGQFTLVTYPRRTGEKHLRLDHVTRNALAARNNEA